MLCPDCGKTLIDVATACRCGWRRNEGGVDRAAHEAYLERLLAEHNERARQSLAEQGLLRRPDESLDEWRVRTMAYVKEKFAGINKAA